MEVFGAGVGVHDLLEVAADVGFELGFGLAGLLVVEHVVAAVAGAECGVHGLSRRDRAGRVVGRIEADEALGAVRVAEAELPDVVAAPVVADDDGLFEIEGIEEAGDVGADDARAVGGGIRGGVGAAVAAHVRRDGVEAGIAKGAELVTPGVPELGPAMAEDHGEAGAAFGDVHRNAICLDLAMGDFGHGRTSGSLWR